MLEFEGTEVLGRQRDAPGDASKLHVLHPRQRCASRAAEPCSRRHHRAAQAHTRVRRHGRGRGGLRCVAASSAADLSVLSSCCTL
eukprot:4162585-Lingulodinium_polyedra.AAC.1